MNTIRLIVTRVFGLLLLLSVFSVQAVAAEVPVVDNATAHIKLPLSFVPNRGQFDDGIEFQAQGMGGELAFTPAGVTLSLPENRLHLRFDKANPAPEIAPADALPGVVNYLIGSDPARWQTAVPTYTGVDYRTLYTGIDLRFDGLEGTLKGTYTVAPGADPAQIGWWYEGAERLSLDGATGDLHIALSTGEPLIELAPVAWQDIDGQRVMVDVGYRLDGDSVRFDVGAYDPAYPLLLDPTLVYSTYFGSENYDFARDIAVDDTGIYLAGWTYSQDFPATKTIGISDNNNGFITKLTPDGSSVIFSTLVGGGDTDSVEGMTIDSSGNIYFVGNTWSEDFPMIASAQENSGGEMDAYAARLNANGAALTFATYIGGSAIDEAFDVALSSLNKIYITGRTYSSNFTTLNPYQVYLDSGDIYIAVYSADGALEYATFLGTTGMDRANTIAVDSQQNMIIAGVMNNRDFVTKLNPEGTQILYTTHVRTSPSYIDDLAVDADDNLYVVGGKNYDGFAAKLDSSGATLYDWLLQANGSDHFKAISVDEQGNAYITGSTTSTNFPLLRPFQLRQGFSDAFITKLNSTGNVVYSSLLGGTGYDEGKAVAVDDSNHIYIVGETESNNFPAVSALQQNRLNYYDTFAVKISQNGPEADVGITSGVDVNNAEYGQLVTFTIGAWNQGPDDATGVQVLDLLPDGLVFASAETTQGSYEAATGIWTIGTLPADADARLYLSAYVDVWNTGITNEARIIQSQPTDYFAGNNTTNATIYVLPIPVTADSTTTTTPTATITMTPTNLATATPTEGIASPTSPPAQCISGNINVNFAEFQSFGAVRFTVQNNNNVAVAITSFNIQWVQRGPGMMSLAGINLGGANLGDPSLTRIWRSNSSTEDANPPTSRQNDGQWLSSFTVNANSQVSLFLDFRGTTSTLSNAFGVTAEDFTGSTLTIGCFSVPMQPNRAPTPTWTPNNATNTPNPPTATATDNCVLSGLQVRFAGFYPFGVVRMTVDNQNSTAVTLTDFDLRWIQRAPDSIRLQRVTAGGSSPFDPNTTVIWQADAASDDQTPPTYGRGEGTWVENYTFPPGSWEQPIYLDFNGTTNNLYTAFGVIEQDFNGTTFAMGCSQVAMNVIPTPSDTPTTGAPVEPTSTINRPILIAPANQATLDTNTPLLTWEAVPGAQGYTLYIQTQNASGYWVSIVSPINEYRPNLLTDGEHRWRVQAIDSNQINGPWSDLWSFTVNTGVVEVPIPERPTNGSTTNDAQPTFGWSVRSALNQFEIQLDTVNPPQALYSVTGQKAYESPTPLLPDTYYWRVRSIDPVGNVSGWSAIQTVTIISADNAVPSQNVVETRTPTISWTDVTWATGYEIQVDNNATFASLEYSAEVGVESLSHEIQTPLPNGTYFWRVRAKRPDGTWGVWSVVDSFTINAG
jgi:uncharacterized repeat protein (TIGR01451 family)